MKWNTIIISLSILLGRVALELVVDICTVNCYVGLSDMSCNPSNILFKWLVLMSGLLLKGNMVLLTTTVFAMIINCFGKL